MTWELQELSDETLSLLAIDGLGSTTLHKLVQATGGLHEVGHALLNRSVDDIFPSCGADLLRKRMQMINTAALRMSASAAQAKLLTSVDSDFPAQLRPLPACPALLWYRGNIEHASASGVAIVGSRRCTQYGRHQTDVFSSEIARADLAIFSGGARGIDGIAHRAAIRSGSRNVVVLGSGIRMPYPPEHASLFDKIVEVGGVVISEFQCDRAPQPANFPRRNRIVSGLSSSVLVIEAAKRSGALITARIAVEEHGREVFVLPGRIGDSASAGCLRALEEGWVRIALEPGVVIAETKSAYRRLMKSNCEEHQ